MRSATDVVDQQFDSEDEEGMDEDEKAERAAKKEAMRQQIEQANDDVNKGFEEMQKAHLKEENVPQG